MRSAVRVVAWLLLAAGCGSDGVPDLPPGIDGQAAPSSAATADPLAGLPPCVPPDSPSTRAVEGLVLPPGTVVQSVRTTGPVTEVRGFVERTPLQVHGFYEARDDVRMLNLEEEGFEAEALYSTPGVRVYVKAKAFCASGSSVLAVVGSGEAAARAVPTPAGD